MPAIETAMGGVGTHVQPKDSASPSLANPSAAAQTTANSLPPGSAGLPPIGGQAPAAASQASPQEAAPAPQAPAPQGQMPVQSQSQDDQDQRQENDLDSALEELSGKKKPKKAVKAQKQDHAELDSALEELTGKSVEPSKPIDFESATEGWPDALKFTAAKMRAELAGIQKNSAKHSKVCLAAIT